MNTEAGEAPSALRSDEGRGLAATAAATALVLFAAFPHRLEYAAHIVAGFGLAGIGVAVLRSLHPRTLRAPRSESRTASPGSILALVVGIIGIAVLSDLTVTGPLDVLDVANTTMGALLGIATLLPAITAGSWPARDRTRLLIIGLALCIAGLIIRYPVQGVVKHWWWFGT